MHMWAGTAATAGGAAGLIGACMWEQDPSAAIHMKSRAQCVKPIGCLANRQVAQTTSALVIIRARTLYY